MTSGSIDVAEAERALASGDPEAALAILAHTSDPAALHLRALAYRRVGRLGDARQSFEEAMASAPHDASTANNFANLLRQMGDRGGALHYYDRALALRPAYRDAAFNKALLLSDGGEHVAALALLEGLAAANLADARVQSAKGRVLRCLGQHRAAAAAYDEALRAEPKLPSALKGRAQIALECGESDAAPRYLLAVSADPDDLGSVHGYAEALEAAGSAEVAPMLETILAARPDWIAGHVLLARVNAERGNPDFTRHMHARAHHDPALALVLANTLALAGRWDDALAALPTAGADNIAALRAYYLSEAGQPAAAIDALNEAAGASPEYAIPAARAHLRLKDPAKAARVLERALKTTPDAMAIWGLLEIAWRALDDDRWRWLSGQPGMISVCDIGFGEAELAELALVLRDMHRMQAHPVGQSLRGGTQTRGALFLRREPILARLRQALLERVNAYVAELPPVDDAHPLLKFRDAPITIDGSWSVRLAGGGFHVNHVHTEGLISSACYIVVPTPDNGDAERAGWLELGRPPSELGLQMEPLATIEPRPCRLALFPSYLFHGTRPFSVGERLTVAFDVKAA